MIRYVLIFSLWALPSSLQGQYFPVITFQKFYDNTGEDEAKCIIRAQDDHLLIGGNSMIESAEGLDCANVWILKVDTLGELIWQQEITVRGCEELRDMTLAEDGSVLFTGVTNGMIQHSEKGSVDYWGDVFVGKVSPYGRLEWVKTFGGSRLDQAFGIAKGTLAEYLVVGGTHSQDEALQKNAGMSDVWTLKLDPLGKVILSETIGGPKSDWAQAVARCANGDFLIAGFTNSSNLGEEKLPPYGNGLVIRMRDGGYLEWSRTFSCPRGGYFTDIQETPDGRIVLTGTYDDPGNGRDFWWLRLTAQGRLINQKTLPQPEDQWLEAVDICADNGFILGGYSRHQKTRGPYRKGGDDFWILRTDKKGDVIWMDTYGGPDDEKCRDVLAYRPGVFYAIGDKYNHFEKGSNSRDFWLIRLEELPADSIQAGIFVRAPDYQIDRETPTRFRARCQYGDRFLWDFGDGSTSTEKNPLKSYRLPGMYEVSLTVFVNESCQETVKLEEVLEVW
jgi:hypothetical protein